MAKPMPTPGKTYTVQKDDTLSAIALRAYGDANKWSKIYRANVSTLKSGNPDLIYPGDVIVIPSDEDRVQVLAAAKALAFADKPANAFTVVLDGLEVPVMAGRFGNSIDSVIDEWTGTIAWTPGLDPELDRRVSLKAGGGGYCPCEVYLGPHRVLTGRIYEIENALKGDKRVKNLRGNSLTADIVDSDMRPPLEFGALNLKQLAAELLNPLGYKINFTGSPGNKFEYVKAKRGEKVFAFLARLAVQRGFLVANDEFGNVVIKKASTSKAVVGTLTEGEDGCPVTNWSVKVNFRERFHTWEVYGQSGDAKDITSAATDAAVPVARRVSFSAGEVDNGSVPETAKWRRSRAMCKALTFPLPVSTWYAPDGSLWAPDTLVRVVSPTLELSKGFVFCVTNVEFEKNDDSVAAVLSLAPPQALTGADLVEPWS